MARWEVLQRISDILCTVLVYLHTSFCKQFNFTIDDLIKVFRSLEFNTVQGLYAEINWYNPILQTHMPKLRQQLNKVPISNKASLRDTCRVEGRCLPPSSLTIGPLLSVSSPALAPLPPDDG